MESKGAADLDAARPLKSVATGSSEERPCRLGSGQVLVDFVQSAMDAVVQMMDDAMQAMVQVVKEAGIPPRLGGAGSRDAAKTEDCCNEKCDGVFHVSFW